MVAFAEIVDWLPDNRDANWAHILVRVIISIKDLT
jgi:hypothetical protein